MSGKILDLDSQEAATLLKALQATLDAWEEAEYGRPRQEREPLCAAELGVIEALLRRLKASR